MDNYSKTKLNFDQLRDTLTKVFVVDLNSENWALSNCTCSYFLKKYHCYHIIDVAAHNKVLKIPTQFCKLPIGAKIKRVRKPKAASALIKQN